MPFLMIRQDITKVQTDAIVNPANIYLEQGSGTSRAIYLEAGEEKLTEACRKIGHCDWGKAVITEGFNLPAKHVIHTVCPVWIDGKSKEYTVLYSAYIESLKLAKTHGIESIAFPLLSAGNYGFPKRDALKIAVSAINEFLFDNDMMVYLVVYDKESVEVSQKLFASIEEYIDDHYVEIKNEGFLEILESELSEKELERRSCILRRKCKNKKNDSEPQVLGSSTESSNLSYMSQEDIPEVSSTSFETVFMLPKESEPNVKQTGAVIGNAKPQRTKHSIWKNAKREKKDGLEMLMEHSEEAFSQMLLRLIDERGMTDVQAYKKANIDKRLFSKIRSNEDYTPSKKTIFCFAIALKLSMEETEELLKRAGYAFSNCFKFDVVVSYFIENKKYDIFEINEVLFQYDLPILGGMQ